MESGGLNSIQVPVWIQRQEMTLADGWTTALGREISNYQWRRVNGGFWILDLDLDLDLDLGRGVWTIGLRIESSGVMLWKGKGRNEGWLYIQRTGH